jgi:hypothetical protein
MQQFSGWQYLLIDVANQMGLDKLLFEERIQWAENNLDQLESLVDQAETKPLYMKAVQAIRKAQKGIPTGHLVGFDACCSGIQIMSAITGCVAGATATGLVDPNVRADAYSTTTEIMNKLLHDQGIQIDVPRKDAKAALMTSYYGSKAKPIEIFGENTPELAAFYQAAMIVAPGAWELLQDLLASWQPYKLVHAWKLPDGYDARVKVMEKVESRVEVDELDHATFTYEYWENHGTKKGLSNVANVVHSIDAYILRCIHRRCNYDAGVLAVALQALLDEQAMRLAGITEQVPRIQDESCKIDYYVSQYERSGMADVVIFPYLKDGHQTQFLSDKHINQLITIGTGMMEYAPFEVITIHDEFKCHPNHMNHLRQQYINIFAELAESNILSDILSQIHGCKGVSPKLSNNLGGLIRQSNYALS